ncbi:unnamed protein product [Protopolystoma xenopodis]|uniref:Fibronectin type-III domain-containing protein n=1 Tax=Protopolystoma xenopodis TaxID=117903 RepID=A0A448XJL9_9PLAT|nr:unnamed protein product [Protopolystoma xenopodis]
MQVKQAHGLSVELEFGRPDSYNGSPGPIQVIIIDSSVTPPHQRTASFAVSSEDIVFTVNNLLPNKTYDLLISPSTLPDNENNGGGFGPQKIISVATLSKGSSSLLSPGLL